MAELSSKIKEQLALLYERPEFKALEAWNNLKQQACMEQMIGVVMGQLGSSERIAMLQGQAEAHRLMLLELRKIHKEITKD
jgi:hypothetical protein